MTSVTAPLPCPGYDTGRESLTFVQRELKEGGELRPLSGPDSHWLRNRWSKCRVGPKKMTSRKRSEEVE